MTINKKSINQGRRENVNALQQLFKKKISLAAKLVEDAEYHLDGVILALRKKALGGDLRAIAMYIDYVVEKSPERLYVETTDVSVDRLGESELNQAVAWHLKQKEMRRAIIEHAPISESHSEKSPPPLQYDPGIPIPDFSEPKREAYIASIDPIGLRQVNQIITTTKDDDNGEDRYNWEQHG
jgi:hypothetical protein